MFKRKCKFCKKRDKIENLEKDMLYLEKKSHCTGSDCFEKAYYHLSCLKETICNDYADNIKNIMLALRLKKSREVRKERNKNADLAFFTSLNAAKEDLCNEHLNE